MIGYDAAKLKVTVLTDKLNELGFSNIYDLIEAYEHQLNEVAREAAKLVGNDLDTILKKGKLLTENESMKEFIEENNMTSEYLAFKEANEMIFFDKINNDIKKEQGE
jgi:hypothetical protein